MRGAVEMHAGELAARRGLAVLDVDHVVGETKHFATDVEHAAANLDESPAISSRLYVLLHRRHAAPARAQIARGYADPGEQMPGRLVELADIPHHAHMADMIALPRIDRAAISQNIRLHAPSLREFCR